MNKNIHYYFINDIIIIFKIYLYICFFFKYFHILQKLQKYTIYTNEKTKIYL
jgi:hypothetical protein